LNTYVTLQISLIGLAQQCRHKLPQHVRESYTRGWGRGTGFRHLHLEVSLKYSTVSELGSTEINEEKQGIISAEAISLPTVVSKEIKNI